MTDYRAPLDDMVFVIREIGDLPGLRALPGWEEVSDDLVLAVLEGPPASRPSCWRR